MGTKSSKVHKSSLIDLNAAMEFLAYERERRQREQQFLAWLEQRNQEQAETDDTPIMDQDFKRFVIVLCSLFVGLCLCAIILMIAYPPSSK